MVVGGAKNPPLPVKRKVRARVYPWRGVVWWSSARC
ncbi:hypothetical protein ES319_A07G074100v1 [Gossypium barbadense]|uniref:Uncharacterized protein n=1 Tax=Gossypium barbadense TaxID=3634 RepID=A0A5J5V0Q8_GOSBA|nr:hypothetical protein ES319_A07G074100v1 [Gossypium barbadense]